MTKFKRFSYDDRAPATPERPDRFNTPKYHTYDDLYAAVARFVDTVTLVAISGDLSSTSREIIVWYKD